MKKGILEIMPNKSGFIRFKKNRYIPNKNDIFINRERIKSENLRNGDEICFIKKKKVLIISKINDINKSEYSKKRIKFRKLIPLHPNKQILLSKEKKISNRIIDIISPIGKGQRGIVVSPPKSGKTIILKNIGLSIKKKYPNIKLMTLLVDERPEEVTDMKKSLKGTEIYYSTFDESPYRHIQISELVLERAKRLVEIKKDVVILLDSITRLARAYNSILPSCGKTLTGGIDSNSILRSKRFLGSARNTKKGGTLTIIGTSLICTGSKMDEIIYEEFKGTGNMEMHLERNIAYEKIFPAINIKSSGTRRDELLFKKKIFNKIRKLRKFLLKFNSENSIKYLINRIKRTKNNDEFFNKIK
ncbi:transcription termination factor Rho [Candidatus Vidania fulgoroideorum]